MEGGRGKKLEEYVGIFVHTRENSRFRVSGFPIVR